MPVSYFNSAGTTFGFHQGYILILKKASIDFTEIKKKLALNLTHIIQHNTVDDKTNYP